jgi:hypothetical protein
MVFLFSFGVRQVQIALKADAPLNQPTNQSQKITGNCKNHFFECPSQESRSKFSVPITFDGDL